MKIMAKRNYYSAETECALKCFKNDNGEYDIYWRRIARELDSSNDRAVGKLAPILKDHFVRNNPVMTGIEERYKEFWNVMINCTRLSGKPLLMRSWQLRKLNDEKT